MFYQQTPQPDQSHFPIFNPGLIGVSPLQHVPTGQQVLPPLVNDMFLIGFSDCAQEAIRYLVDVEGLSPHDPMVLGLQQHLYEQQRIFELNVLLRNSFQLNSYNSAPDVRSEVNITQGNCEQLKNSKLDRHDSIEDKETIDIHETNADEWTMNENVSSVDKERTNIEQFNPTDSNTSETDVPKKVADLVNELFSLLQEEENDMYQESDSDVDEGFDELVEQEVVP